MKIAHPNKPAAKKASIRRPNTRMRVAKKIAPTGASVFKVKSLKGLVVEDPPYSRVIVQVFDSQFSDVSDVAKHRLVSSGVKTSELMKLIKKLENIPSNDLLKAIGISSKTIERNAADKLSLAHSGSALALMEIAALAENVLGSDKEAQAWLLRPAIALENSRPIDLLTTPPGIAAVKTLLQRIDYGVYA